jgi:8-oxo-dGTP diphosphatase
MAEIGRFIAGVGILVRREDDGRYLLLRRAGSKDYAAGRWECVTGRVDQGEGFEEAAIREVQEEIGVTPSLAFIIGTTHFYRGDPVPENELVGVMYAATLTDPDAVRLSAEHDAARWLTHDDITGQFPTNHWLRTLVARADRLWRSLPANLLAANRRDGFEL